MSASRPGLSGDRPGLPNPTAMPEARHGHPRLRAGAVLQSPWTEVSMRLGQRVIDIVRRFDITPPNAPSLVPIGGVQTSPMKLAQAYASLENGGMLPQIRFLRAAIGPRGNIVGLPVRKDGPRVMSSATASSVLQALRGPVKRGTARSANSAHALVYGKTGTSSPQRGCPVRRPHPGHCRQHLAWARPSGADAWRSRRRHAGKIILEADGTSTVRLAQTRYAASEEMAAGASPWGKLKIFAARQPGIIAMIALGSLVALLLATGLVPPERARRGERSPSSRRMKIATFNINNINKRLSTFWRGSRPPSPTSSRLRS